MKNLLAGVWCVVMVMAFVLVAFGVWSGWTLTAGIIAGFVYMIFTK